jgi:hypothetical protein
MVGDFGSILHTTTGGTVGVADSPRPEMARSFSLRQNYPNPFNPSTTIGFSLKTGGLVSLKIYNLLGSEVATLVSARLSPGLHEVTWNAQGLPSGVYYCRLLSGDDVEIRKLVLLR